MMVEVVEEMGVVTKVVSMVVKKMVEKMVKGVVKGIVKGMVKESSGRSRWRWTRPQPRATGRRTQQLTATTPQVRTRCRTGIP